MKFCLNCNAELNPKVYSSGEKESPSSFNGRTCCNRKCRLAYDQKRRENRKRLLEDCKRGVYDYAALDECRRWIYVDALKAKVQSMGYDYITEAIHDLYVTVGPSETARRVGLDTQSIWNVARKMLGLKPCKTGGARPNAGRKAKPRQDGQYNEIAEEFGVTPERARQIADRAMEKFKRNWTRMYGADNPFETVLEPFQIKHRHRINIFV